MTSWLESVSPLAIHAYIERLGWTIVHSLWQFALLAALAWMFQCTLRRSSSSLRYAMHVLFMALIVAAPCATWFALPTIHSEHNVPPREAAGAADLRAATHYEHASATADERTAIVENNVPHGSKPAIGDTPSLQITTLAGPGWVDLGKRVRPWLATLVTAWICGVLAFSARPILGWYTVRRLCRVDVGPISGGARSVFERMQERLGIRRAVRLLQSTRVCAPVVVGCFRSTILLPASLLVGMPLPQLEAILAHELAHVRRYDYLVNLAQTLIETFFFYHPAVWWLSHRVRVERENCCDDVVVAALGDRVQYGRALLAVEEFRSAAASLALQARSGSLVVRMRRLAGLNVAERRSPFGSAMALAIPSVAALVLILLGVGFVYTANADEGEFGPKSHGLQVRLVPLSPETSDDSKDFALKQNSFATSNTMTFGVELKNISDKKFVLAGVRYGEGYKVQGDLNTNFFAPHLFQFIFSDRSGNPLPRAERDYFEGWAVLDGASTHELAPGESLKLVLRPAQFNVPMDYELPPGQYLAQVKYRGPSEELLENVRRHWPERQILDAWPHEAESNQVEFSIEKPTRRAKPEELVWSEARDGLQAAIEFLVPDDVTGNPVQAPGVPLGTPLGVVFHVRNSSDKVITFVSETGRQGDGAHVTDEQGNEVPVPSAWISGWPIDVEWKLKPGEVAKLHVLAPGLQSIDQPGRYNVHYTIRFNSRIQKDEQGNVIFPRPGDYQSELDTGITPLVLLRNGADPKAAGSRTVRLRVVDAENDAPISGVIVKAYCWEGECDQEVHGTATTDADGTVEFSNLQPVRYHWALSAANEVPYIGVWTGSAGDNNDVVIRLQRACELELRAVDAETGEGIAGVKFGRERMLAELWMQVVVPDTLGANRPVRYEFDNEANGKFPPESDYETDAEGRYRCLVGPETWSYMVYDYPPGYDTIEPIDGRQEVEIETPSGGKVEYTFRLVRSRDPK